MIAHSDNGHDPTPARRAIAEHIGSYLGSKRQAPPAGPGPSSARFARCTAKWQIRPFMAADHIIGVNSSEACTIASSPK